VATKIEGNFYYILHQLTKTSRRISFWGDACGSWWCSMGLEQTSKLWSHCLAT